MDMFSMWVSWLVKLWLVRQRDEMMVRQMVLLERLLVVELVMLDNLLVGMLG
jgi:hypothetical protein